MQRDLSVLMVRKMNPSIYSVSPCDDSQSLTDLIMQKNSFRTVLSLTSKDQGFPPATMYMTPGHFERNQKENTTHSTSSINGIYLAT